jgi:hypothetical protein
VIVELLFGDRALVHDRLGQVRGSDPLTTRGFRFPRAGNRGRTGDRVRGKPIDSGHHDLVAHRASALPVRRVPVGPHLVHTG